MARNVDDFRDYHRKKLEVWLNGELYHAPPEVGPLVRLVMRHLRADGSTTSDIKTCVVDPHTGPENAPGPEHVERMADELLNAAVEDADGMGRGMQRYVVLAFHDRRAGEHSSRHLMRLPGGKSTFANEEAAELGVGELDDSEGASPKGVLAQHMRFTEALMKQHILSSNHTIGVLSEQNKFLSGQMRTMAEKHMQMVSLQEELLSRRHQRELDTKKQEVWLRSVDEVVDKLKILLPHLVNKSVGRKLLPTRSSPGEQELVGLIETMRPEQLDALKSVMNPDQVIALVSIFERVAREAADDRGNSSDEGATVTPLVPTAR